MSVYQGSSEGGGTGIMADEIALDTELMQEGEKLAYLTQKFGSESAARAYMRATESNVENGLSDPITPFDTKAKVVGCADFTDSSPTSTRISRYFTLDMLSTQTVYTRYPIVAHNGFSRAGVMCNLKHLAVNTLDPIRDWDKGFKIGSGFRSNSSTDHGSGSAVDIYFYKPNSTQRMSVSELVVVAKYLINGLKVPFTQLLLESSGNGTGWIHVALRKSGVNSNMRVGYSLNNGNSFNPGLPKL
jgi:hypothetical protein